MIPNCVGCGRFTTNTFKRIPDRFGGFDHDDWYCVECAAVGLSELKEEVA